MRILTAILLLSLYAQVNADPDFNRVPIFKSIKNGPLNSAIVMAFAGRRCEITDIDKLFSDNSVTREQINTALKVCAFAAELDRRLNRSLMTTSDVERVTIKDMDAWYEKHLLESSKAQAGIIVR